ncbi:unnamed protein product [Rotaria magnacalcarata]|uniref:Uncharacterized protein n=1 Tax=Rotaria magnacalcarata TaxID=392030 RepID=A0A819G7M8_9BILA|nr:unnamed protein product [Rotaria magnacalcarata]CAF2226989.1 unnamed protein product [Rotaria magnacalcarata]CAF3881082.1 unnamed protein product [Rotaria magnacalcarata]CAF3940158.1 unnamed protein product [Rotaria magnacalcarata]
MSSTSLPSSSSSSNRFNSKKLALTNGGRTRFSPSDSLSSINHVNNTKSSSNAVVLQNLLKLNQLVDTLKSLKRVISHYFDQISKQGESVLAGDVRRVYRRILLLYVKYRRRQNYEKRRMKQPIEESDDDDDDVDANDDNDNDNSNTNNQTSSNTNISPIRTMKKIVGSQNLPFTRAGFDADHDGIDDFDEIALAATRDVANIQTHCVRLMLNDHQMKLPIYGLQTRWDSEIPKQRKQFESTISSTANNRVEIIKKTGIKSPNVLPLASFHSSTLPITTSNTTDQELFLGSLARQLNEQTWQQLRSILANLNSQTPSSPTNSHEQSTK